MAKELNSHEYAVKLQELAAFLLSKSQFATDWGSEHAWLRFSYWTKKDDFLGAVKAVGAGKKKWGDHDLVFIPKETDMLRLMVSRSAVCKKVQEEKWECEPLLSQEEEELVGVE